MTGSIAGEGMMARHDLSNGSRNVTQADLDWLWDDSLPFPRTPFDDDDEGDRPLGALAIIAVVLAIALIGAVIAGAFWLHAYLGAAR